MARLEEREDTYFTTVRGMCRSCREVVPARVFFRGGGVCPSCANEPALIASDQSWYMRNAVSAFPDRSPVPKSRPPSLGCPRDCGPCTWHASMCQLPVFSITNRCELRCPICFTYNRRDKPYDMSMEEMKATLDWISESSGPVDLVNITGGEPTMHPRLIDLLGLCARPGIGRITMNSNGLRLGRDFDLCRRLADLNVYVILSFSTFDRGTSLAMHGADVVDAKLAAMDNLTRAGARMTILFVLARGINEGDLRGAMGIMENNDSVLNVTVQTIACTGQGGGSWPGRKRIPVDEAAGMVCASSNGKLAFTDFLPRPSAHPLCYLTCYMLKSGRELLPFARFAPPEEISMLMADSYLMRLGESGEFFRDAINRLYARGESRQLGVFRALLDDLYPKGRDLGVFGRQRRAESSVRSVYVHAHMDEDNFDCTRAMLCPDLVPASPGKLVPACTYNLFHRMKDERFHVVR